MQLFNSLTRRLEEFKPLNPPKVGVYTCGPTVYDYVSIGNWRTYFLGDLLVRALKYFDYQVHYAMNITDVGHLTGDNLGDASTGEDRLEKGAKRENKTAWEIAKFYAGDFRQGFKSLNMIMPTLNKKSGFCVATDHIQEQIKMVQDIEKKGFAYKISDGIYFDVQKFEQAGFKYGVLSNIDQVKEGARVEPNPEKRDPRDFALWKFSYHNGRDFDPKQDDKNQRRQMEWSSPWGLGFPGWHIECSAMSTKYLGKQFDIHLGGEDLRSTHHPNEIAQTEAVTGQAFVKYWLHGAFLQVDGGRMGKSLGNAYNLHDLESKGFTPEHLRYFYFTGHYRKPLNFTWESLKQAKISFQKLFAKAQQWDQETSQQQSHIDQQKILNFERKFQTALSNDLNAPQVLAIIWDMVRDTRLNASEKLFLLLNWDDILGFDLEKKLNAQKQYSYEISDVQVVSEVDLPEEILGIIKQRITAKNTKDWQKSDQLRDKLQELGFKIEDLKDKISVKKVE